MKRVWPLLLLAALVLAGCKAAEEGPPSASETQAPHPALGEAAQSAYAEIAQDKTFTVTVEETDGTLTALDITPENAWNVEGPAHLLAISYDWFPAEAGDWDALVAAGSRGYLLSLVSADGGTALRCCSGGDVVELTAGGETLYARAVNPKEGQEPYEGKLYHYLDMIAEDAYSADMFGGTVDGAVTDLEQVAAQLAEQAAETVRGLPGWMTWKPADFQVSGVSVFDAYRGEPENFCCGMGFRLLVEDPNSEQASYWQAGSGLGGPDGDGYYNWGQEVLVMKNSGGSWYCADRGTGGYSVLLPFGWAWTEGVPLEDLVDAFFLTEGFTHDWLLAKYIVAQPSEALAELPELLAGRTEAELQNFGATLAALYRDHSGEEDWASWEDLRTALGPYAVYLDA